MNKSERLELAQWVVAQARKHGADDVAVDISNSRDIEVECRERKIDQLKESVQNSLSLDIYAKGRYSGHSTNDLRKDSLSRFIQEAVAMTKYLTEDPYRTLPDPKYYGGRKSIDLHIYDPNYEGLSSDVRVKIAREMEDAALSQSDRITACTTGFSDNSFEVTKVHSNGFEGERRGTVFSAGASITVRDDQDRRPEDWEWRTSRFLKDLPPPETLAKNAVKRALRKIGQTKLDSGLYDMILENRAASRLLGALYAPMRASSLQQRNSFLEGKLGQSVGSEKLTLIDDPFVDAGLGSRLFDGEGMATKRRVMVDKGVLKAYYIDCYYGRKLDMEPTTASITNLTFDYGSRNLDDMVKGAKKAILVAVSYTHLRAHET